MSTRQKALTITIMLALTMACMAQDAWWNKDWKQRIKITLNAGMTPGEDSIASTKIALADKKIDLTSARLIDSAQNEIPCVMKKDTVGDYFIGWRPKDLKMLEKREYYAYFDGNAKTVTAPTSDMPENLPGMNLIPNADFIKQDSDGHPDEWSLLGGGGAGKRKEWDDANKDQMKVIDVDGKRALELSDSAVVHLKVKPDRQYKLSYDGKYEGKFFYVTVWYRGKTRLEYLSKKLNVGNYKMQTRAGTLGEWYHVEATTFVYGDLATDKISYNNKKLLKCTETAFIEFWLADGKGWIANIRYEDITDSGTLKATIEETETLK